MPPNTLCVNTEYILDKSVGSKVCGLVDSKIVEVEIGGVAIYRIKKSSLSQALTTFIPSPREGHNNNNISKTLILVTEFIFS
ncbi:hypothetical protein TNCV_4314291 [Trichonephila clavipes]|nr:hypothetical protein TNCV_4314291 [Trichonephila clavipes]